MHSLSQTDPFQSCTQEQTNFPLFSLQVPPLRQGLGSQCSISRKKVYNFYIFLEIQYNKISKENDKASTSLDHMKLYANRSNVLKLQTSKRNHRNEMTKTKRPKRCNKITGYVHLYVFASFFQKKTLSNYIKNPSKFIRCLNNFLLHFTFTCGPLEPNRTTTLYSRSTEIHTSTSMLTNILSTWILFYTEIL